MVGPATLTVVLGHGDDDPATGATVRLEGHMTHAGMAPVLAAAVERFPGVYEMSFAFSMRGDWVLLVSAVLPDGRSIEQHIDVANVQPPG